MRLQPPIFRTILEGSALGFALPSSAMPPTTGIARRANGRSKGGVMPVESLSTRAYRHLRDEIFSGRLRGGTVVSEAAIAKSLKMSRTPVGDAIRQLVREGLVDQVPRYGTVVREVDRAELIELYEVREALESYAASKVASRPDSAVIQRLDSLCDVIDSLVARVSEASAQAHDQLDDVTLRDFLAADMAFHLTIVQAAGNRRILDFVTMSRSISRVFKTRRTRHELRVLVQAGEHHRRIAAAIRSGDPRAASAAMLDHIHLSKQQTLESLDQERTRGDLGHMELPSEIRDELEQIEQTMIEAREATASTSVGKSAKM